MPVKKCSKEGHRGHKYGDSGKCYHGENSESKAKRQGSAIEASKAKKGKK